MVPKVASMGRSFKGIGMYMLHDKGSSTTSERVMFTHTHNLPTRHASRAMGWMAHTAMHQKELKRASGASLCGRPLQKSVYSYSLAWHPSENPTDQHMVDMALESLKHLGLSEHEAVIVGHDREDDEIIIKNGKEQLHKHDHKHIHVIVNRVHPETGIAAKHSYDRLSLGEWALNYERERGQNFCPKRETNRLERQRAMVERKQWQEQVINLYKTCDNGAAFKAALTDQKMGLVTRKQGYSIVDPAGKVHSLTTLLKPEKQPAKLIRERLADLDKSALKTKEQHIVENFPAAKQKHDWKTQVTDLFKSSDSGRAFKAALNEQGIDLALGNRGFCLVDEAGKVHNLNRRIEGYKSKDIRAHLSDIDKSKIQTVDECLAQRETGLEVDSQGNRPQIHTMSKKSPYPELTPPGMPSAEDSRWVQSETTRQKVETEAERKSKQQAIDQDKKRHSLKREQDRAIADSRDQTIDKAPEVAGGRAPQAVNIKPVEPDQMQEYYKARRLADEQTLRDEQQKQRNTERFERALTLLSDEKRQRLLDDTKNMEDLEKARYVDGVLEYAELELGERQAEFLAQEEAQKKMSITGKRAAKLQEWEQDMRDRLRHRQSDEANRLHANIGGRTAVRIKEIKDYYQLEEKQAELKNLQALNENNQHKQIQGAAKRLLMKKTIDQEVQREFEQELLERSIAETQAKQQNALNAVDRHEAAPARDVLNERHELERQELEKKIALAKDTGVVPDEQQYDVYRRALNLNETTNEFNASSSRIDIEDQVTHISNDNTPDIENEFTDLTGEELAATNGLETELSKAFDFEQELESLGNDVPDTPVLDDVSIDDLSQD